MEEKQELQETEEILDEEAQALPEETAQPEPYTPRPLGFRIFAWVLAILVIIGTILYYYNIMTAK